MEWKLFADLAEVAGDDRITVSVPADATVGDALEALLDDRPALRERVLADDGTLYDHVNLLRNGADASLADDAAPDDELALFPPVSGG
ncbi:molybdopterin synthase sulfur carrier subunit [Halarchaeum rubridurum]|uniref:Molybdopterin synthase sulfur carrier subunit n=1 Tax=Halarchaeum rubridurum TaxID=489911 RepID=A0A830FXZ3_9EURY|nr:ubiquitin-like small modifier protein 1 [Halarchaeum rubridurum]MBP1953979.1 molybdopterin synthase sulfur carrier subunit [Halarchaeum rubridurum]GGM56384.1 molybdopterin synthase sulfur carrier subunit [Halarchaeum rubridurum]